jgi:hypothetical protein
VRITLAELTTDNADIDRLEILSLEGQLYMARVHRGSDVRILSNAEGKTLLMKSAWQIQDRFGSLTIARTEVVHDCAYDQMVGMAPAADEPMRVGIQGSNK